MLNGLSEITIVRMIAAFAMLGLASFFDLKKREINDILWIGFSALSAILIFLSPDIWTSLRIVGVSLIIAPVALVLWRFGVFGGADAFCLIVLASLAPMFTLNASQITPFSTLTNAAILSVTPLFVNLCRNVISILRKEDIFEGIDETRTKKIVAVFVGYKAKNPKYSFSLERIVDGKKRLDFSLKHAEQTLFCNDHGVWVTPGVPYVLYITAGFVIQVLYGDLIFNVIRLF
ncbi:hypothetical protein DYY66_0872 [Candidatus Nitrosotalea sp. FS]|uniref:A24 family peptidase n=1 Tax=Candidatus Nitrosotalea sp. FS TaxID=2341021 RepID=UPI00210680A0|nr:A24 family peptidase [Candidatus Nitrosotalea sp. FS]NHH97974.1 hypothetical protein [Candidatus Nitrosotalea sp. FS]